ETDAQSRSRPSVVLENEVEEAGECGGDQAVLLSRTCGWICLGIGCTQDFGLGIVVFWVWLRGDSCVAEVALVLGVAALNESSMFGDDSTQLRPKMATSEVL
ncbi:hypothetical protein Drorol1_Dr00017616, partial [Drosera rotundifolia]